MFSWQGGYSTEYCIKVYYLNAFNSHVQPQSPHFVPWQSTACNLDHGFHPTHTLGYLFAMGSLKHLSDLCAEHPTRDEMSSCKGMKGS